MPIDREDLKEIVAAVAAAGIEDFSLEVGDVKVRLRKQQSTTAVPPDLSTAAPTERPRVTGANPELSAPSTATPTDTARLAGAPQPAAGFPEDSLVAVKAPLIGTFYRAPAPDAPPFIEVGSLVEPDDTVCIVEVMKLMNQVRAGCRGQVAQICAENATLVEYGQTLILIEPAP
jgi:acetyl-CoA carboxylase biotin carboxyl carrier protein